MLLADVEFGAFVGVRRADFGWNLFMALGSCPVQCRRR